VHDDTAADVAEPVLSEPQRRALAALLDEIIPRSADGRLPGAGELGLVAWVEDVLARTPALGPVLSEGLQALDAAARGSGAGDFARLPPCEQRAALLREVAAERPQLLSALVFHTYAGYYQHPRVLEALGLEPRPPFPKGYELAAFDVSLLDCVRRREPFYRHI
jgi:hypothetical protein